MKRFLKSFCSFGLVLLLILSLSITSFADVNNIKIGTGSNALMTLDLNVSDRGVSLYSSIGSVVNTIDWQASQVRISFVDTDTGQSYYASPTSVASLAEGNRVTFLRDSNIVIKNVDFLLTKNKPVPGNYLLSFDYSSDISNTWDKIELRSERVTANASTVTVFNELEFEQLSGDVYGAPVPMLLTNTTSLLFRLTPRYDEDVHNILGTLKINFTPTNEDPVFSTASVGSSSSGYEDSVSSSISDLSSSVDTMTDEISGVTEAIQNLQGAMEPHYSNVLTQLHHITEQLHAFWDQQFNLHHVPLMAKLTDIIESIGNMDLEVEVNLNSLKTSIDNMSQAIQNKLQSVQDTLTNGFDNSGINQDAAELDQSLQEYEEAEQTVIDQVNDSLNDFEFDSGFEEYTNTIKVFSDFIQDLYEASGGFKVVINLSLMLSIAGIVIGVYRFRDGG